MELEKGKKVSVALWLGRGAAEVKDAVWNVGVAVWLVMMQPPKVCMWPCWWVPQPCQGQDAEGGAAFSPADLAAGCPLTLPCQGWDLAELPVTAGHVSYLCHSLLRILLEVILG